MWRKGSNNYAKTFFSIYFQFLFLTSFHLVGSKSWDSFILLNESANTDFSFFGGWGAGLHRNRSHHGLLTVRSQTTGTLWYLYTQHFWQKSGQRISCTLIWLFGGVVWHFLILQLSKSLPIYLHSAWKSRKKGLFRVEDLSYIRSMEYPGRVQDNHEVLL